MIIRSESEMLEYGRQFAKTPNLKVVELIGDVGAGKTTFMRGLAQGLKIQEPVTSPSFTISKSYSFIAHDRPKTLVHYDFYRLQDPGIMTEDLAENLADPNCIVAVEWGESVDDLLPEDRIRLHINYRDDGSREIIAQ